MKNFQKHYLRKTLALVMAFLMIITMMPVNVFAETYKELENGVEVERTTDWSKEEIERLAPKSENWNLAPKNKLRGIANIEPARILSIKYLGSYVNDDGRDVARFVYTGKYTATQPLWKNLVIKVPNEFVGSVDFDYDGTGMYPGWDTGGVLHDYYHGQRRAQSDAPIMKFEKMTIADVGSENCYRIRLNKNDNVPSASSNLNIPIDFVLKDGKKLSDFKNDLLFQARVYNDNLTQIYTSSEGSDQTYTAYTFSTILPAFKNYEKYIGMHLATSGESNGDFGGAKVHTKFNLEDGYVDVYYKQYKGNTFADANERYGLRQSVDKDFYQILKPDQDNNVGEIFIADKDGNHYSNFYESPGKPDTNRIVHINKDAINYIDDVGFIQVVNTGKWDTTHEYKDGVTSIKTQNNVNDAILNFAATGANQGVYTVIRYYVDSAKVREALKDNGMKFYTFHTAIVRQNNDGIREFSTVTDKERVIHKNETVTITFDKGYEKDQYVELIIGEGARQIYFADSISKENWKRLQYNWKLPMGITIPKDTKITVRVKGLKQGTCSLTFPGVLDQIQLTNKEDNYEPQYYRHSDAMAGGVIQRSELKPNVDEIFTDSTKITGHTMYEGAEIKIKNPDNDKLKEQVISALAAESNNADKDAPLTDAKDVNGQTYKAWGFDTEKPNQGSYVQKINNTENNFKFEMPKLERDMPILFSNKDMIGQNLESKPDVIEQVQTKVHFDYQWDMNQGKNVVEDKIVPLSKEYKYDPETGAANANYKPSGFEDENVKYADENKKTIEVDEKIYQNIANHDGLAYDTNEANQKVEFMKRQFPENPDRTNEGLTLVAWSTKDPSVFATEYKQAHSAELAGKTDEEQKKIINKALIEELKQNELDETDDWADTSKAYSFTKTSPVVKETTVYAVYDTGATIILHANKNESDNHTYEIKINKYDFVNGKAIIKIPEAYYNQYDEGTFDAANKPEFKQDKKTFAGWTLTKEDNLVLNGKLEVLNKNVTDIDNMIKNRRFNFNDIKEDGTNYLPNGYSLVLEGTYADWIKKGNIDLYAQYRDFIDVSVDKRFRSVKPDGSYSTIDDVNTNKKHKAKIGLIYRTAVTDWTQPTVHSAANYNALPRGAYGYAETLKEYNPVSDQASSNETYAADVSWKLPGFDKYGQRLSYAAVEIPIGKEDNYYNFKSDWSKLGIRTHNNLNTQTGLIEQDPNAPKDPIRTNIPLAKSQEVTLEENGNVDAFTAATYRNAVKGKTVGANSEVKAYEITMTNVPLDVPKPSIKQAFDGEKTITIKYYDDRVEIMQVTFPGNHPPTNIEKTTVGGVDAWTSATVGSQYLKIDNNKADKTLTLTYYPGDLSKTLHTGDKVLAQNFIGTVGSEIDEMIVKPKEPSNKVTEAEQTHNDANGNSTIEMETPNPTVGGPKEGTKYVLVKQNDDGTYPSPEDVANGTVTGVDTKEVTKGAAPGAKLKFTIPENDVKDGDKFKIISIEPRKTPEISDIEITIDKKAVINDANVEDSRFRIFTEITGQIAEADIPQDGKIIITINDTDTEFTTNQGAIDYLNRVGLNDKDQVTFKVVDKYGNEGNATAAYAKTKQLNIKVDPVRAKKSYIYLQSDQGANIIITVKRQGKDLGTTNVTADGTMQKVTLTTGKLQKGDVVVLEGELNGATSNPFAMIAR